jgi:hypothetical protein
MEKKPENERNLLVQVSMPPDCREWWAALDGGHRSEAVVKLIRKEIKRSRKATAKRQGESP